MSTITRRSFIQLLNRGLAATGLVAVFTPIVAFFFPAKLEEIPSEPLLIGKTGDIPLHESKTVKFGRYPALVINTDEGIKAYSAVCTHFACVVKWEANSGKIYCPCHDGYFDAKDGHVISGPPPLPLDSIKVNIENGDIYIGGAA